MVFRNLRSKVIYESYLAILSERSSCFSSYRIYRMIMKVGQYHQWPMLHMGCAGILGRRSSRGQFWPFCLNDQAASSPTDYIGWSWMLVSIINDHWYIWGVQEFEVKGHLGVNSGHFVRTVKLLLLLQTISDDHESWSVWSSTNSTYGVFSNLRSKVI